MKKQFLFVGVIIVLFTTSVAASHIVLRIDATDAEYQDVIKDIRDHPFYLYFKLGMFLFKEGDYRGAIQAFTRSISLKHDFVEAYHNVGVSYYELNETYAAQEYFEKSVRMQPEYQKGRYSLALLLQETGAYGDAVVHYDALLGLNTTSPSYYFDAGTAYVAEFRKGEDKGKIDLSLLYKAKEYFEKAETLEPGFSHAEKNKKIVESVITYYVERKDY